MKSLLCTAALAFFLCASAHADDCQSVVSLSANAQAHDLTMVIVTAAENVGAIDRAVLIYNAMPGDHVGVIDALEFINLPNGGLYIALSHAGVACAGLDVQPDKVDAIKQALLGEGA